MNLDHNPYGTEMPHPLVSRQQEGTSQDASSLEIAVVGERTLYRDCLVQALNAGSLRTFSVRPCDRLEEMLSVDRPSIKLVILCLNRELGAEVMAAVEAADARGIRTLILAEEIEMEPLISVKAALRRGLAGFMLARDSSFHLLESVIPFLLTGGTYLPPELFFEAEKNSPKAAPLVSGLLTGRQRQVLRKVASGKSNKAISFELDMSASTVKVHIGAIMKKLGAKNRTEVAVLAHRFPMHAD